MISNPFAIFANEWRKSLGIQSSKYEVIAVENLKNEVHKEFCLEHDIEHSFSAPRTLQQNSALERKNKTIQEMTQQLNAFVLPKYF